MKKIGFKILSVLFLGVALIGFSGVTKVLALAPNAPISDVLNNAVDKQEVTVTGKFLGQIDDDEFIFSDSSGRINVKVKDYIIRQLPRNTTLISDKTFVISGIIDKGFRDTAEIKVASIKIK
ncbi:NirD/YgiW/YdeI family stress tolerance protein [Candidatus Hepatincolaceae symbiont of Richtersius coronifer]